MTTYNENKVVSFEAIWPAEADTFQYSIATMEDGTECVVIEYLDTFPSLTVQVPESMLTATPEQMTAYAMEMQS